MRRTSLAHSCLIAIVIAVAGGGARASFVTNSPDPFPPGSGFVQAPGCLTGPLTGLCTSNVVGRILSSSFTFPGDGQAFVLNERVTGDISDNGVPSGSFVVTGPLDVTLLGRDNPLQTGTFDGKVTDEFFQGTFDGASLEFTLDPSHSSTAEVTIAEVQGERGLYRIDSFFDLFSQISIAGGPPIPIGGFPISGIAAPEPPTWVMLAAPLLLLGFLRGRLKA